jgi:bud emergence protein 1
MNGSSTFLPTFSPVQSSDLPRVTLPCRLVAKPIARTGGPGLIPISFVEIRDPLTQQPVADVQAVLRAGGIPKVEEWKQQTAKYKKESIPLGRFEFDSPGGVANSPYARPNSEAQQQQQQNRSFQPSHAPSHSHSQSYASQQRQSQASSVHPLQNDNRPSHRVNPSTSSSVASSASAAPALLPPGTISSASVVSFHSEADEFLFRIHANFLPHDSSQPSLRLIIFRLYDDFYHFQIDLLDTFRLEAGRAINPSDPSPDTESRILPFMPGPLDFIDNAICSQRTKDLDVYMRQLVALHRRQAGYVLEHDLVRGFFAPRNGDMAKESPREEVEDELRKEQSLPPMEDDDDDPDATLQNGGRGGGNGLENAMDSMGINNNDPRTSYSSSISASNNNGARPPSTSTHTTNDSSRPSSANHDDTYRPSTATTSSSSSWGHNTTSRISASTPLSASLNSSSQSHSASHSSTGGASAAFKKIKIFDRATDDLIAIRVPTNVTYDQLKEKVQDRLGGGVRTLKYRDSMAGPNSGGMQLIEDDESLEEWLRKEDKLDKLML